MFGPGITLTNVSERRPKNEAAAKKQLMLKSYKAVNNQVSYVSSHKLSVYKA